MDEEYLKVVEIQPSNDMVTAAAAMWDMYQAYTEQGFTDHQAMALCIAMVQASK